MKTDCLQEHLACICYTILSGALILRGCPADAAALPCPLHMEHLNSSAGDHNTNDYICLDGLGILLYSSSLGLGHKDPLSRCPFGFTAFNMQPVRYSDS